MNINTKIERNLKICHYRFSDILKSEIRKVDGKDAYTYGKLAKIFNLDRAAVIRICQQREKWMAALKKMSKDYLK